MKLKLKLELELELELEIKHEWKKRGFITKEELSLFIHYTNQELIRLTESKNPVERTGAATILGQRKASIAVVPLCQALKTEKALYTKIAISETIGHIGAASIDELIALLGIIGNNQHKELPIKPFEKWNYPLPRDIAARTITKIGEAALVPLQKAIDNMKREALLEAIDAVGFISFYGKNKSAYSSLLKILEINKEDHLIVWKIIRALQSFSSDETKAILEQYVNNPQQAIRWEAKRSLEQINKIAQTNKNGHACFLD